MSGLVARSELRLDVRLGLDVRRFICGTLSVARDVFDALRDLPATGFMLCGRLPLGLLRPLLVMHRVVGEVLRMIGLRRGDLLEFLEAGLGVASHLLHLVTHFLRDADRLLLGEAADLALHFEYRFARLPGGAQHLLGARGKQTPRAVVAQPEELRIVGRTEKRRGARLRAHDVARGLHLQVEEECRAAQRHFRHALQLLRAECLAPRAFLRLLASPEPLCALLRSSVLPRGRIALLALLRFVATIGALLLRRPMLLSMPLLLLPIHC
ncbi:MAG TPA: hypothetical protein VGL67_02730 [Casimicrobiaceae bacterium]